MRLEDNLNNVKEIADILDVAPVAIDLVTSIIGEDIGRGTYRAVYEYNLDDRYVVKIEPENTSCNLIEYMIWDEVKGLMGESEWVKKWFAPVKWISPNGRILIMQKTHKRDNKVKPEKIPKFLWDVCERNFGWIGNNYVCHDYGQLYNMIAYPKAMKKIEW